MTTKMEAGSRPEAPSRCCKSAKPSAVCAKAVGSHFAFSPGTSKAAVQSREAISTPTNRREDGIGADGFKAGSFLAGEESLARRWIAPSASWGSLVLPS